MKISVFTSSHLRHRYLIYKLSKYFNEVLYICEKKPYIRSRKSLVAKYYFKKVKLAEKKIFGNFNPNRKNIVKYNFKYKNLSYNNLLKNDLFKSSDIYLVFGSSIIKGKLLSYLLKKKAMNLHMGLLPFYRGTDCNFWAIYDNNLNKVGASLIRLSKKIDDGKLIKSFKPKKKVNKYLFSMSACKNSIDKLPKFLIKNKFKFPSKNLNKKRLIRFSYYKDFNDIVIKKFLKFNK